MNEKAYLSCQIMEETTSDRLVISKLFDGTSFQIRVPFWDVIPIEDSVVRDSWLKVEILGRDIKNNKTTVKLPAPALTLGSNINVASRDLATPLQVEKK